MSARDRAAFQVDPCNSPLGPDDGLVAAHDQGAAAFHLGHFEDGTQAPFPGLVRKGLPAQDAQAGARRDHEAVRNAGDWVTGASGFAKLGSGLGVEDGLDHTLALAERDRLAVADEGEAADLDLPARLLRLRLRHADRGDLGLAIGAARD